jgi:hypothetical protein
MNAPEHGTVTLFEMEDVLGIPREHLSFTLWYLKESGAVVKGDNGKFAITLKGVDLVEAGGGVCPLPAMRPERMLTDGSAASAA